MEEKSIDAAKELSRILQNEIDKIWEETPLGYNETNNAYHIGKGIMIDETSWNKYLKAKEIDEKLSPMDYMVETIKKIHEEIKKDEK